jgi:uncharacterized protein
MSDALSIPHRRPRVPWRLLVWLGAAVAAAGLLLASRGAVGGASALARDPLGGLASLSTVFLGIVFEAIPFVLLGVVVSSALHLFVSERVLVRLTPRRPLAASLTGAMLGLAFPVCECGVVPVSRRLMQKGAPLSLGVAFLLAAPVVNPVVIASTWVAFGGDWRIVAWRVGLTIAIAAGIGLLFAAHPAPRQLLRPAILADGHAHGGHDHGHPAGPGDRARELVWHSGAEFVEMSRYLVLGALLAAAVQTFVPRAALLGLGETPLASVLVMMGLGVLLSICSTVDAFVALGFAGTFSTGALLAFLVYGPMVDIKAALMYLSVFERRAVAIIVILSAQMVLLASLFINFTWP